MRKPILFLLPLACGISVYLYRNSMHELDRIDLFDSNGRN